LRNLAAGNKMNFTIFTFLVIAILVILVCGIVIVLKYEKEEYQVNSTAFIYDYDYNYIELQNMAVISKKWTGNYYLKENISNQEHKLGKYAVSFEKNKKNIDLFGEFYQVLEGGNISKISGYNTINSSSEDKFYKIDDRKYLIIARNIENDTGSLSTENYLIIIVDKLGNALLLNNEINAKTINEMIISTDDFSFDVANEILRFDEEEINLKKIIGSTNEYKPTEKNGVDENETEEENTAVVVGGTTTTTTNTNNNSNSTTIIQNGTNINAGNVNNGTGSGDKTWVDSLNGWIGNVSDAFESIYNKGEEKEEGDTSENNSLALNSLSPGTTYIDVNYTINDPDNKYNVVYLIVSDGANNKNIALDKNATTYRLTGLTPDKDYTIQLGYKEIYSDATTKDTIEDSMTTRTIRQSESLKVTKISLDRIYYTLKLDSSFVYDTGAKIKFYINGNVDEDLTITLTQSQLETAASIGYSNSIKIPTDFVIGSSVSIELEDTKYNGKTVYTNLKTKIINY